MRLTLATPANRSFLLVMPRSVPELNERKINGRDLRRTVFLSAILHELLFRDQHTDLSRVAFSKPPKGEHGFLLRSSCHCWVAQTKADLKIQQLHSPEKRTTKCPLLLGDGQVNMPIMTPNRERSHIPRESAHHFIFSKPSSSAGMVTLLRQNCGCRARPWIFDSPWKDRTAPHGAWTAI